MTVLDYASHRSGAVVTEDAPLEPYPDRRGAYTQSKLQAERIVAEAVRARGLPAVIVRPGMIFGPGAEGIPPYGTIAVAGRWIVVGAGRLRLPLVYVDDVVSALVSAASVPGIEGRLYHLVDPAPVTQNEYVAMCEAVNRGSLKISHVGRPVLYAAAATLAPLGRLLRRSLPLTRYRIASINELRFDCSRAQQDLSWAPTVGVESGLERAFGRVELRPVATVS
jgi:nucleoside-diphosphate-sugar epimerase